MAVSVAGFSVVIRSSTLNAKYPGGGSAFAANCPNHTFCTDGNLVRVGFMTQQDAWAFTRQLAKDWPEMIEDSGSPDLVICDSKKPLCECDWLRLGDIGGRPAAWLATEEPGNLFIPEVERHSAPLIQKTRQELAESYEFLGTKQGVDVFREKGTGKMLYIGRTQEGAPPAHISTSAVQQRFTSLVEELARLGAMENTPPGEYQGDVAACYERARSLVEDTQASEPGPLQLQGIAARLLGRWDDAAQLFRRVTEMRPDYSAAWLELTWALASLRRFKEAEASARRAVELDPGGASALGNLAAVLFEQGRIEEARSAVTKALMADPTDAKNRSLLTLIERAKPQEGSWWRRLLKIGNSNSQAA